MIKQNLLNLAAKIENMKMTISQEKAERVSWFVETELDNQA